MPRPPSIDKHLTDLERFFGDDEWQFGTGHDFHAQRAIRSLKRYITRLERQSGASRNNSGITTAGSNSAARSVV